MPDDEHDEEDEFPNMFENSDEEDPWKGSVVGRQIANQVERTIRARQTAVLRAAIRDLKSPTDAEPTRHFSKDDLNRYVAHRKTGLAAKSLDWISRSAEALWDCTSGEISHTSLTKLRDFVLHKYKSADSHSKVLSFTKSFLSFLARTKADQQYLSFGIWLDMPKAVKEKKSVTSRIVVREDVRNVLRHIRDAEEAGRISSERAHNYAAFVLFSSYTGQRSMATSAKLTVGQFRKALKLEKPVLLVESPQDKIRMTHHVPLAPRLVPALEPLLEGRDDDELMFMYSPFLMWIKRAKIPMSQFDGHFVLGDMRKFFEQQSDALQLNESIRAHIATHGVGGVSFGHYRNPQKDVVYDVYMSSGWRDVDLTG